MSNSNHELLNTIRSTQAYLQSLLDRLSAEDRAALEGKPAVETPEVVVKPSFNPDVQDAPATANDVLEGRAVRVESGRFLSKPSSDPRETFLGYLQRVSYQAGGSLDSLGAAVLLGDTLFSRFGGVRLDRSNWAVAADYFFNPVAYWTAEEKAEEARRKAGWPVRAKDVGVPSAPIDNSRPPSHGHVPHRGADAKPDSTGNPPAGFEVTIS